MLQSIVLETIDWLISLLESTILSEQISTALNCYTSMITSKVYFNGIMIRNRKIKQKWLIRRIRASYSGRNGRGNTWRGGHAHLKCRHPEDITIIYLIDLRFIKIHSFHLFTAFGFCAPRHPYFKMGDWKWKWMFWKFWKKEEEQR